MDNLACIIAKEEELSLEAASRIRSVRRDEAQSLFGSEGTSYLLNYARGLRKRNLPNEALAVLQIAKETL